jgi:acyl carrier protein
MGLDGVEIVMAVEDAFGVEITDLDAARLRTPRDVVDFIASRVPITEDAACLSQRAFHLVRSSVLEMTPHQRRAVTLRTPLAHLFTVLPARELSERLATRLKRRPPLTTLSTVRDLVVWLGTNSPQILKRGQPWTREEISAVVKEIVVEQLGLESGDYGEEKRFVEDLGMN